MGKIRGRILWVDDEIDHLKPHILFLEEKGYQVTSVTNGQDAIALVEDYTFHLVLLDQTMPGLDGMETLRLLKDIRPNLAVIMITKSEEEWLMDAAISEKISQFLIKPVNTSQILMACKQVLEKNKIREDKVTSGYLKEFQEIEGLLQQSLTIDDWWDLYNRLVKWQINFDEHKDIGLGNILEEQILSCNREFVRFIEDHYPLWMQGEKRPAMSTDILPKVVHPLIEQGDKVCLIVVDCLRHDQLMAIMPEISQYFEMRLDYHVSLLPSATPFSRNAIFSGLFPDELVKKYPQQMTIMQEKTSSFNQYEDQYVQDHLIRLGLKGHTVRYQKINSITEGKKFYNRFSEYLQVDLLTLVVNFVDMLAHKRSQSDVLKEMVPDESGYRYAVKTWFENSWLYQVLKSLSESDYHVIITSDHGSIRVNRWAVVGADRESSVGVRYKYGRNLNCADKSALVIRKPAAYRLPDFGPQSSYLIAKDDIYFVYPTQIHRYQSMYKDSFQHGGISMEELLVPILSLKGIR